MQAHAREAGPAQDPLLAPYLAAAAPSAVESALCALIEHEATPVMRQVLWRKNLGSTPGASADADDMMSVAREQLIRQLMALRSGEREQPIGDFRRYAASVAYAAWAEQLRNDHPRRSMLLNRIRYLLEKRGADYGLALWQDAAGTKWCGPRDWESRVENVTAASRLQQLLVDPVAASGEIFGRSKWSSDELLPLLTRLLGWIDAPIELRDLVSIVGELSDFVDAPVERSREESESTLVAPQLSPSEELAWKEYLQWLWLRVGELPPRQCCAFLLGSSALRDFELQGIASIRSLAPRFALPPERLAELWQRLPLDDLAIASELGCTRQQVINLRRVARDSLGRAWMDFQKESSPTGNKPRKFSS
ncbi:MAG: hypothetical protein ABR589_04450 [Chthoniobacterales bacterium]